VEKQYVADIKDRDTVGAVFLVKEKIMAMAKNGKPYMNLRFMDKTGEVDAKIWDNTDELDKLFDKNDFVRVRGKASVYLNKMQVVVAEIHRVPEEEVDLSDFLPESLRSATGMRDELRVVVGSLSNRYLKALMTEFLADDDFMNLYCKAPAAKGMHHVYLGGLLEHSLSLVRLIRAISPLYEGLNTDLLIAGALLHDVGKIHEMSYDRSFDYTDAGKLLGHITIGVELVSEKIRMVEDFPKELELLLKHMLLSHHGQYEFGSPKRPKTVEATILNYLDDLDSKINGIRLHIDKEAASSSRWTAYHRLYDRYFFKANGLEEELEEGYVQEQEFEPETARKDEPESCPSSRREKQVFSNQPLRKLENLNLFGSGPDRK